MAGSTMNTRHLALLAVGVLAAVVVLAGPSAAQEDPVFTEVASGDDDANRAFSTTDAVDLVWVNFDGDNDVDPVQPAEPVYVSLSFTTGVNFGDVRLTDFLTYPTGTVVNYTNRDAGLTAKELPGWFARDSADRWFLDGDDDGQVSVGDLRLNTGATPERVRAGDAAVGRSVEQVQGGVLEANRILHRDEGPSGVDWEDTFYLDLDGNGQVNPGELRFQGSRLGIDDAVTARGFQDEVQRLEASDRSLREDLEATRTELVDNDQQTESRLDALREDFEQARADLDTMDKWLLALGLVDLVAVAGLGIWVYKGHSQHGHEGE